MSHESADFYFQTLQHTQKYEFLPAGWRSVNGKAVNKLKDQTNRGLDIFKAELSLNQWDETFRSILTSCLICLFTSLCLKKAAFKFVFFSMFSQVCYRMQWQKMDILTIYLFIYSFINLHHRKCGKANVRWLSCSPVSFHFPLKTMWIIINLK